MNAPLQLIGRWITAAIAPSRAASLPATDRLSDGQWLRVIEVANIHRLVPAVGGALRLLGESIVVPDDIRDYFTFLFEHNRVRNDGLRDQARELIRGLNAVGIQPLLLKGIAEILKPSLPDPAMRFVGDIDLLIPEADLEKGVDVAFALGYRPNAGEMKIAPDEHHFPALFHSQRLAAVEIHRTLGRKRHINSFDPAALFLRALEVEQDGLKFHLLSPTDATIYAAYHSQLHHFTLDSEIRASRHLDFLVLQLLDAGAIDAPGVERWFANLGEGDVLEVELALIARIFGYVPHGFQALSAASEQRARLLVWRAEIKGVRRIWRTVYLLRRAFSRERFESERGGGSSGKLFRWRMERLFSLSRKYANPLRILRLSRWFDSSSLVDDGKQSNKKS